MTIHKTDLPTTKNANYDTNVTICNGTTSQRCKESEYVLAYILFSEGLLLSAMEVSNWSRLVVAV
jgi:hypothetical protein